MSAGRRIASWIVGSLVGLAVTLALAPVLLRVEPGARSLGRAWFAAPGAALFLVLVLLARKLVVARAKSAARRGIAGDS